MRMHWTDDSTQGRCMAQPAGGRTCTDTTRVASIATTKAAADPTRVNMKMKLHLHAQTVPDALVVLAPAVAP